ncbi:MAG TPA: hypothetical protein VGL38_13435 [bacterium]
MLETALIVAVLAFLVFIVGGVFFGVPKKYLGPALVIALLLVLVYLFWHMPPTMIALCLFMALVLSARLMFFRAP